MRILACDTTTPVNSLAVWHDGRTLAEVTVVAGRRHTERLLPTLDGLLRETGIDLAAIDTLAVSHGPGSFTGLRVGIATWKGLALAAGLPLVGVPTLDAMTRLLPGAEGLVCPLIDARMKEVFGAVYRVGPQGRETVSEAVAAPVEQVVAGLTGPVRFFGDGADLYRDHIAALLPDALFPELPGGAPRASAVAAEAAALVAAGAATDPRRIEPVYLRGPRISPPRKGPRGAAAQP